MLHKNKLFLKNNQKTDSENNQKKRPFSDELFQKKRIIPCFFWWKIVVITFENIFLRGGWQWEKEDSDEAD